MLAAFVLAGVNHQMIMAALKRRITFRFRIHGQTNQRSRFNAVAVDNLLHVAAAVVPRAANMSGIFSAFRFHEMFKQRGRMGKPFGIGIEDGVQFAAAGASAQAFHNRSRTVAFVLRRIKIRIETGIDPHNRQLIVQMRFDHVFKKAFPCLFRRQFAPGKLFFLFPVPLGLLVKFRHFFRRRQPGTVLLLFHFRQNNPQLLLLA